MATDTAERKYSVHRWPLAAVPCIVGAVAMALYVLTVAPTASYWDCPEYIASAWRLEIGHPPGNPTWMLAARMATLLGGGASSAALAVNLSSALFTALAAALLAMTVMAMTGRILAGAWNACVGRRGAYVTGLAGITAGLAFAVCDTAWFSAVEAEVYAFSIFMTALIVWLGVKIAGARGPGERDRLIILVSYLTGLSVGVHQLTLLCLPAFAMLWAFGRNGAERGIRRGVLAIAASFGVIVCILFGLMPGSIAVASAFELAAVNAFGADYNTGVMVWVAATVVAAVAALVASRAGSRVLTSLFTALLLALSGLTMIGGRVAAGLLIALLAAAGVFVYWRRVERRMPVVLWSVMMLLAGYSSYALVIIRGAADGPMNQGRPGDVFAFRSYLEREQYGSKPLLYGRTPESRLLRREKMAPGGLSADYSEIYREKGAPLYRRFEGVPVRYGRNGFVAAADSDANARVAERGRGYLIADYDCRYRFTPELDMWFPRIVSGSPGHMEAYASWIGLDRESMTRMQVSEAVDSAGRPVGKLDPVSGKRVAATGYRPSYLQNLQYFASYQLGYMYLRYLMWNFSGRQNDIYSQGEADNGNFITGFDAVDDLMLGNASGAPDAAGKGNAGRHAYYMLPLLLGVAGMVWQLRSGRGGRRMWLVTATLFVMTGIAITVYLNQSPQEPRERDYSFVGSFYAYCMWIGAGAAALAVVAARVRRMRRMALVAAGAVSLAVPVLMACENYADHDRSGRTAARDFAVSLLKSLDSDAIIFVNGDNLTFPLWYAQEVEGVRRDVSVVNIAYLATPWYPLQLMRRGEESLPVPLTAPGRALAYGGFAAVTVPAASVDTLGAVGALRSLYASREGATPRFMSRYLRLPGAGEVIDLRGDFPGGSKGVMMQNALMMLDIVATNAASAQPRPLYWAVGSGVTATQAFGQMTVNEGIALRYTGRRDDAARRLPDKTLRLAQSVWSWGGLDRGAYADYTVGRQAALMRRAITTAAVSLADSGRMADALCLARIAESKLPPAGRGYRTMTERYVAVHTPLDLARVYHKAARSLSRPDLQRHAEKLVREEFGRLMQWRRYVDGMPRSMLGVVTAEAILESREPYAAVEAWREIEGRGSLRAPGASEIDWAEERRRWLRDTSLRHMLRDARHGSTPAERAAHYKTFTDNGGDTAVMSRYREFDGIGAGFFTNQD